MIIDTTGGVVNNKIFARYAHTGLFYSAPYSPNPGYTPEDSRSASTRAIGYWISCVGGQYHVGCPTPMCDNYHSTTVLPHMQTCTRPSCFSAFNIEKLGGTWGRG